MSPHKSAVKKSLKHPRHSHDSFRNDDANTAYIDHYKNASIVMERSVDIESLENTFIPKMFKERTWTKLLNPLGDVGQLKKKALHAIEFSLEMRALAYILIFNLYSVKNLITLSRPRTIFLHDLHLHEIDICGHIYHLSVKCIKKRKSRLTLPFPSLLMSLISRVRVKILSGLLVMQREEPISEHTIIRSKAHIPDLETDASQIPRDETADEGGNTKDEIDQFTHVSEDTPQSSYQAQVRAPDCLDLILGRVE
ncbi:hypothetical protein SO802_001805 [Lithocarpus litseifolius]|uniref:Uncharacterized protein n=1 Tax=Lithocarpus litseifolius TaxID=425828 RepID=A0AAW2E162_9ROSI